jgi:capsular polysaccharide transport system permease protein
MFFRGLRIQAQVVYALVLRETRTRFGKNRLGYLWAVIEPLLVIGTFAWLMSEGLRHSTPPGMTVLSFLATGFIPYHFFNDINARLSGATRSNRPLLYYPRVLPIDLLWARFLLEFSTQFAVFLIILGGDALYYERLTLDSVPLLLTGLFCAAGLGAGVGVLISALGTMYPVVDRIEGALFRPMMFISGIWFTANELPVDIRELLMWNPVLHCTELVRDGWFTSYQARYANAWYPLAWALALLGVGLTLERVARRADADE